MEWTCVCACGRRWPVCLTPAGEVVLACPACGGGVVRLIAPPSGTVPRIEDAATLPPLDPTTLPPVGAGEVALDAELVEEAANPSGPARRYEIIRELGRGGMGVVYQARQRGLNRVVALKMMLAGSHAGAADLARFRTEAEAIARLTHPHVVQVYETGEQDGLPYFSLEYCAGGSLEARLQGRPLPPREAAVLVEQLARGVQAAHDHGILHRDLKPANVLFAADHRGRAEPKITDFGLAKKLDGGDGRTKTGAVMGTPSYMAPEQAEGRKDVGPAADVYALGAILYECLTGRPPFRAATALDTILQVVSDEPVPPRRLNSKVPRDLEVICTHCLQKAPAARYPRAADLADDLRRMLAGDPISARPPGVVRRTWKAARKRPIYALLAAFITVGVVVNVVAQIRSSGLLRDVTGDGFLMYRNLLTADPTKEATPKTVPSPAARPGDTIPPGGSPPTRGRHADD
jgi:serine/threonine protein kinase